MKALNLLFKFVVFKSRNNNNCKDKHSYLNGLNIKNPTVKEPGCTFIFVQRYESEVARKMKKIELNF